MYKSFSLQARIGSTPYYIIYIDKPYEIIRHISIIQIHPKYGVLRLFSMKT